MDLDFYAELGDVSTIIPWKRPTLMTVTDWWKEFSFEVGVEEFDIWLVGSFMEKTLGVYQGYPNDLDVVLTGDIPSYSTLKKVLDKGIKIGFEKRLMVDMFWCSDVLHPHREKFQPFSIIRAGKSFLKTQSGETTITQFTSDEEYELPNGLTQFVYYHPTNMMKKVQERKDLGEYVGVVMNAREFFE